MNKVAPMIISHSGGQGVRSTALHPVEVTFERFCEQMAAVTVGGKDGPYIVRGGEFVPGHATRADENLLAAELLMIDADQSFDENGEIHHYAPPFDEAVTALEALGHPFFINTTHSHTPDAPRWRAYFPCRMSPNDLAPTVTMIVDQLIALGLNIVNVAENNRWSQPWYKPRVPSEEALKAFRAHSRLTGTPIDTIMAHALADERKKGADKIRAETFAAVPDAQIKPVAPAPITPIESFNKAHDLSWVRSQLERNGYRFAGKQGDVYRYISPTSTTKTAGVVLFRGKLGDWCTWSHHGAHDPLSGKVCDPFALEAMMNHNGDSSAASKAWIQEVRRSDPNAFRQKQEAVVEMSVEKFLQPGGIEPVTPQPSLVDTVEAFAFDVSQVPPRPWIVSGMLLHGYVGLLVGTGGAGKSLFSLQLATAIAAGANWGGFFVRKPSRVMVLNAEDDIPEQRRRLIGIKERMGVDVAGIGDRLLLANDPPSLLVTQRDPATKTQIATPLVAQIIQTIQERQIDVLIVDPFAETLSGDENASEDIRWVMKIWRDQIARATGCAVLLVHHTPKYSSGMAGDANAARGSGAINAAARTSWTVFPMTEEEATAAGLSTEDRHRYVRVDDAKMNYGMLSGTARWFEKQEVDIGNAVDETPSDKVGVLTPWELPGAFDSVSTETVRTIIRDIAKAFEARDPYKYGRGVKKGVDRCLVDFVASRAQTDAPKAERMIKTWVANGVLTRETYIDIEQRKERTGMNGNVGLVG